MIDQSEFRILLVEDNPDDEALTLRALNKNQLGNQVDVVRDGAAALDYLWATGVYASRAGTPLPQVVLLDLRLPKINGLDVLAKIRADPRTREMPVVMLTSSDVEQDLIDSYERGVNSFVRKPVDFSEFIHAVQQLGLYWLVVNRVPRAVPSQRGDADPAHRQAEESRE